MRRENDKRDFMPARAVEVPFVCRCPALGRSEELSAVVGDIGYLVGV